VIDACTRTGRRVPDDILVIGVDNDELLCPCATVPLSSVDVGLRAVARRAAEMLESQFATGVSNLATVKLANLRVVTRRSTDTVAVADDDVRRALEFIRAKACDRIGVEDVLKCGRFVPGDSRPAVSCGTGSNGRRVNPPCKGDDSQSVAPRHGHLARGSRSAERVCIATAPLPGV